MPTEDVKKGVCGCGACTHEADGYWHFSIPDTAGGPRQEVFKFISGRCPWPNCHYDLGRDGLARRMVECTVEELRKRARDWEQQAADDSGLAIAAKEDGDLGRYDEHSLEAAEADASADALRQLLPKEPPEEQA